MSCMKCQKQENPRENTYDFHVLEVQTLHVRDLSGEKRVQALGRFQNFSVCRTCAEEQLKKNLSVGRTIVKGCVPFSLILLAGILISILFRTAAMPIRFLGVAAVVCGIFGIYDTVKNGAAHGRAFRAMSSEEALEEAAWEVLQAQAPKKSEDSDLTYIPVNKKTLSMKNGDLMICYDLLPEIAVKAYDLIREV
ncbi:MAG: hypothetical protein Q4B85_02820 [Lachnospiraceae bacterium]|nr:hypothetical protein [Lachnospiraceae bacterium]